MDTSYVIDTSVAIKWLTPEKEQNLIQSRNLLKLLLAKEIKILVPDLIVHELSNALVKGKKASVGQAAEYLKEFLGLPLTVVPYSLPLLKETVNIAVQYDLTAYDAIFVALAKINDATLITADPKDQGKVKEVTILPIDKFRLAQ